MVRIGCVSLLFGAIHAIKSSEAFCFCQVAGGVPRHFSYYEFSTARELSIFVDESGSQKGHSRYCIVSPVFHDQADSLAPAQDALEADLRAKSLPNVPFHASPLMYGKDAYRDMETRKKILASFEAFCRRAPFTCKAFAYKRSEVPRPEDFIVRLKRDLIVFLTESLGYFQAFSKVKIYYDNGQQMVTEALHGALDFILSKKAVLYKTADSREYLLSRVADCVCTLELTDLKFQSGELTETNPKVFGTNYRSFKLNHLKHFRRKVLSGGR